HARKERVLLFGTDQRITSGPAARTAAFRGRIHGCTRTIRKKVRVFSCAAGAVHTWEAVGMLDRTSCCCFRRDSGLCCARRECSFDAAVIGAYYGRLMRKAKEDKRISNVPHEPSLPVWTAWDLGFADATAIWFAQVVGREIRIIDYYESSGVELAHYV